MKNMLSLGACLGVLFMLGCGGGDKPAETTAPAVAPAGPAYPVDLANGKLVYDKACFACHMTGVSGAAPLTDKVRWETQAAKGMPTLIKHVTEGFTGTFGTLPAKGTCMDCQEKDLYDAIHYMLSQAGVQPKY
ncbi:MAG: c-type cytochrome [Candidatus Delongbacteria bacterium]